MMSVGPGGAGPGTGRTGVRSLRSIAAIVAASATPDGDRPFACWNRATVAIVSGPDMPSSASGGLAPSTLSDCCTHSVSCEGTGGA